MTSKKTLNLTEKDLFILVSLLENGAQDINWTKANKVRLERLKSKGLVGMKKSYWVLTSDGRVWAKLQTRTL